MLECVYLVENCCGLVNDGFGRVYVYEEYDDVGAATGGDQFPADQGDAAVDERW